MHSPEKPAPTINMSTTLGVGSMGMNDPEGSVVKVAEGNDGLQ
jgi:hypothetical protein